MDYFSECSPGLFRKLKLFIELIEALSGRKVQPYRYYGKDEERLRKGFAQFLGKNIIHRTTFSLSLQIAACIDDELQTAH